ncbi:hypothetical protein [Clostridium cylindrosporum]|uniref:Tetratricopeptide repeat protein n=1 Tax=Clostridium cylindrosporum DSM 605 TaxID=1121307 RepID=A0A0J8DD68_CLOCY|nr:hypothetical protein [Clostridium cylindrosporum]KMT22189.1 hypothetical protein CLCY_4c01620 [Clostridium cylindrosporum DSM 605]
MENQLEIIDNLQKILPSGAKILKIEDYYSTPAIIVADLDKDGVVEICVGYKLGNNIYVAILKYTSKGWTIVDTIKGEGIGLSDMLAVAAETPSVNNLVIGWKLTKDRSKLSIYKFLQNKVVNILNQDVYYNKLEVEDMEVKGVRDGIYEFALWNHDKLDAYNINVYRLKNGKLEIYKDAYRGYFKGIVNYYLDLIDNQGANPIYLYHLANAEANSGRYNDAVNTLNALLDSGNPYPSREEVLKLKSNYEKYKSA